MPYLPIRGYDGMMSEGGTPTALVGITDWEADISVEIAKQGPFLNDAGLIYKVRGAIDIKGTFKGNVPQGEDAATTAVITALTGGTNMNLVLRQGVVGAGTTGYVVTIPTAVITGIKIGQDSKNGASVSGSFEGSGSFSVA